MKWVCVQRKVLMLFTQKQKKPHINIEKYLIKLDVLLNIVPCENSSGGFIAVESFLTFYMLHLVPFLINSTHLNWHRLITPLTIFLGFYIGIEMPISTALLYLVSWANELSLNGCLQKEFESIHGMSIWPYGGSF